MKENLKEILVCGKMCMPCNMLKDWLKENNIEVETIFGEDNIDFCRFYGVSKTPTLVVVTQTEGSEYEANVKYDTPETIKDYLLNKRDHNECE